MGGQTRRQECLLNILGRGGDGIAEMLIGEIDVIQIHTMNGEEKPGVQVIGVVFEDTLRANLPLIIHGQSIRGAKTSSQVKGKGHVKQRVAMIGVDLQGFFQFAGYGFDQGKVVAVKKVAEKDAGDIHPGLDIIGAKFQNMFQGASGVRRTPRGLVGPCHIPMVFGVMVVASSDLFKQFERPVAILDGPHISIGQGQGISHRVGIVRLAHLFLEFLDLVLEISLVPGRGGRRGGQGGERPGDGKTHRQDKPDGKHVLSIDASQKKQGD